MTTITQDTRFPQVADWVVHDHDLAYSWFHEIDTVPTLLRAVGGEPTERSKAGSATTGRPSRGRRPGCRSARLAARLRLTERRSNRTDELAVRFSGSTMAAGGSRSPPSKTSGRPSTTGTGPMACLSFPHRSPRPSDARGHHRAPDEVVAVVPLDLADVTVEKIAINADGRLQARLPAVVIAAVEAICTDDFNMHGVLATTMDVGPIIIVNGPIAREIGMNSGGNVLGQGNRANATIGRAVQPWCATSAEASPGCRPLGTRQPSQDGLAPAEDEVGYRGTHSPKAAASTPSSRPSPSGAAAAAGLRRSPRTPESLTALRQLSQDQPRPEDGDDGDPARDRPRTYVPVPRRRLGSGPFLAELDSHLQLETDDLIRGADGIDEGLPKRSGNTIGKFWPGGIHGCTPAGRPACSRWPSLAGFHRRKVVSARRRRSRDDHRPRPDQRVPPGAAQLVLRPESLDGLTIGLLDISKPR